MGTVQALLVHRRKAGFSPHIKRLNKKETGIQKNGMDFAWYGVEAAIGFLCGTKFSKPAMAPADLQRSRAFFLAQTWQPLSGRFS